MLSWLAAMDDKTNNGMDRMAWVAKSEQKTQITACISKGNIVFEKLVTVNLNKYFSVWQPLSHASVHFTSSESTTCLQDLLSINLWFTL
jgi:hypothetical protein